MFDVIVDIRKASPTFLQWFGVELSAENKKMIYIKTTPDNFTLFQFGRDKMGNRTGLIAHKVKLLGDTKLEMGRDSYSKLVAQK